METRVTIEPGLTPPAHMLATFTGNQVGCARCGADVHDRIERLPFTHPVDMGDGFIATHWSPCPTNREPILYCQGPGLGVEVVA